MSSSQSSSSHHNESASESAPSMVIYKESFDLAKQFSIKVKQLISREEEIEVLKQQILTLQEDNRHLHSQIMLNSQSADSTLLHKLQTLKDDFERVVKENYALEQENRALLAALRQDQGILHGRKLITVEKYNALLQQHQQLTSCHKRLAEQLVAKGRAQDRTTANRTKQDRDIRLLQRKLEYRDQEMNKLAQIHDQLKERAESRERQFRKVEALLQREQEKRKKLERNSDRERLKWMQLIKDLKLQVRNARSMIGQQRGVQKYCMNGAQSVEEMDQLMERLCKHQQSLEWLKSRLKDRQ